MTERLARACAAHPWRVVAVWLAVAIAGIMSAGLLLFPNLTTEQRMTNDPESYVGAELLRERMPDPEPVDDLVIVRSERLRADDPAFDRFASGVAATIARLGDDLAVARLDTPSADGHAALIAIDFVAGDPEQRIEDVIEAVRTVDGRDGFEVGLTGEWSIGHDFTALSESDLRDGELRYGIPAALVVLVLVFGALVAAGLPLALSIVAILVGLGLTGVVASAFELSFFVINMLTAVGLALGIDYSLFVLSRYREERARGTAKHDAIARSGATASRAVLFSGTAVVIALTGMLLVPDNIMRSLAAGAIIVGLVSVAVALTLLPAVLSLLGDRVNRFEVPIVGRAAVTADREGRFWGRIARAVMRRPGLSLLASAGLLVAMAVPVLDLETGFASVSTFPRDLPSRQGFEMLERDFRGGSADPLRVVVIHDGDDVWDELVAMRERLDRFGPATIATGDGIAQVTVALPGSAGDSVATDAVRAVRDVDVPAVFGNTPAEVYVAGIAAENLDYFQLMDRWLPRVVAFVLLLSFCLLTLAFRSLVVALKAILLNLLSVGAAYGLLVLVFAKGYGNELFGFQQVDAITAWVPLFLFCILFGLSMDYHVFLLSRIRERYAQTGDNAGAVEWGIASTGRMITGAALIIIAVFLGFATGELVMFQQMGFGVGVALLLDATLVRTVLVPAAMKLLGDWNWWLPRWLRWLPDVHVG